MAKSKIPGPLERSHLIEKDMDAESASSVAEAYLADGRKNEAIEFLAKAGDEAGLQALAEQAVDLGDPFLLASVVRVTGKEPDRATWIRCAEVAQAVGKERYAETARRSAARSES